MFNPDQIDDELDNIMDKIEAQSNLISQLEEKAKNDYTGKYDEILEEANETLLKLGEKYNSIEAEFIEPKERFNIMNSIKGYV